MTFYCNSSAQWLDDTLEAMRLIMPDVLAREREVANKKWFEYRFMTPTTASRHFASLYSKGFKAYVRFNGDRDEAEVRQGLGTRLFLKPSASLTELWHARQRADELGIPYELLIEFGFEFARRGGWKNPPRPMQLFGSIGSGIAWLLELEKFLNERLPLVFDQFAGLPQYRIENYRGLPVQDEFRAHLENHIRASTKPWAVRMVGPCLEKRHLPLLSTIKLAPKEQRRSIVSNLRAEIELGFLAAKPKERLHKIAYMPSCFGLVGPDMSASTCASCPFSVGCQHMTMFASREMIRRCGSVSALKDARDEKRKAGQRRRTAKCRAKKKLAATPTLATAMT